ncbi:MAG: hypothetical protein ACTHJ0_04725 [Flavipsychrobacter sp.]
MKKILTILSLFVAAHVHAQTTMTVNNMTPCSVQFYAIASHPATCDMAFNSDQVIIPSGTSIAYKFSDLIWHGGTIIPDDEWDRLVVTGDVIGFTLADVGMPCTGAPATATYTAPCTGTTVHINYSKDGAGNATINIY